MATYTAPTTRASGDLITASIWNTDLVENIKYLKDVPTVNGIQFPATQVSSANVNVLDDYEEGTWTPVIGGATSTAGQTYSVQAGYYTKVGNKVTATCMVTLSAKGTITGNVQIQGLPFASQNTTANDKWVGAIIFNALLTSKVHVSCNLSGNSTAVLVMGIGAAATSSFTSLTTSDIDATTQFQMTITYQAAT